MPYVSLGGGSLFYRARGMGHPLILCVHGFCQSSLYWAPMLENIAEAGAAALAPDLPGFGESRGVAGPYAVEKHADRLAELLDALRLDQVRLVGGSMGGVVAQHFALRHPSRLQRLVLVATGPYTSNPAAALTRAHMLASASWSDDLIRSVLSGFFWRQPSQTDLESYESVMRSCSREAAVESLRSNAQSNTLDRLKDLRVPTLIVQGRHDKSRTPSLGATMRDMIPNARLEVFEHSGHTPQLEEPDAFIRIVGPFLFADIRR